MNQRQNSGQAKEVKRHLEHNLARYQKRWFRKEQAPKFERKIDIYLHPDKATYLSQSKAPQWSEGYTVGEYRYQQLLNQGVHFNTSNPQFLTATLPHELVHIVMPHRLGKHDLPKWLDEGLATAEEPLYKQRYFQRVVLDAAQTGDLFPLEELFRMKEYPKEHRIALFYAQSNRVVHYLRQQLTEEGMLDLALALATQNSDEAVRKGTRFSSVKSLGVAWLRSLEAQKR